MPPCARSPSLTPALVANEGKLVTIIEEIVRSDPVAAKLQMQVAALCTDLRRRIDADARDVFLQLDEAINARSAHITVVLVRWAFEQGRGGGRARWGTR